MSVLALPEPPGWRGGRRFLGLAVTLAVVASVTFIYLGATAATHGNYLTTFVMVAFVIVLLTFMLGISLAGLGRTTARTTSDATGFTVWPDRRFGIIMLVGAVVFIPGGLLFAVFAPFGAIELPDSHWLRGTVPVAAGFAVLTNITGLITVWRRGGIGHIKLTPGVIENADVLETRVFDWDDVVNVADHAESKKARRAVVLRLRNGHEEIITIADIYLPRGAALYWLVRHYWRHPEHRTELVDGRAAERLRQGRFDLT